MGKTRFLFQKEFAGKQANLENIVYYRGDMSNYMVVTVARVSLINYDILIDDKLRGIKAFKKDKNKDNNLRNLILAAAKEWNIPNSLNFKTSDCKKKSKQQKQRQLQKMKIQVKLKVHLLLNHREMKIMEYLNSVINIKQ